MAGIDVATLLLVGGIVVLCATTAITALAIPSIGPRRRRRRLRSASPVAYGPIERPARHALALPSATRTHVPAEGRVDDVGAAWDLIEQMLEHHPERLVAVLTDWITADLADTPDDGSHHRKAAP